MKTSQTLGGSAPGRHGVPSTYAEANLTRHMRLQHLAAQRAGAGRPLTGALDVPGVLRAVRVPMSTVLQTAQWDGSKLAAVDKGITHLDTLPPQYCAATTLYISRNNINSLDGVQQLPVLKVLSAGANLLADYSALEPLRSCPYLEVVSMEGNPVCELPNYRAHVLAVAPRLTALDGRTVGESERARASEVLQKETATMATLLANACLVHKLVRGPGGKHVHGGRAQVCLSKTLTQLCWSLHEKHERC